MDIEYLLLLQNFRKQINDLLTPFMEQLSLFAVTYLLLVAFLIYWIYDERKGLLPLASYFLCVGVNATVKLTACVYRPWIRDARIVPAGDSIRTATGYSFPSGHVSTAGPLYGGIAEIFRNSKKWISVLCITLLLLTGFSRNYLGVHTPQDVVVAMIEAIVTIYFMKKILRYVEEHPEKEDLLLLLQFLFALAGLIYITVKPYPMDYVDGVLIVDPQKMMNDGYGDLGMMMFFPLGRYIEKRWIRFKAAGLNENGLICAMIGALAYYLLNAYLDPFLISRFGSHWGRLAFSGVLVFFGIVLFPFIIKKFFNKEEDEDTID